MSSILRKRLHLQSQNGFSLLEILMSLILIAILATVSINIAGRVFSEDAFEETYREMLEIRNAMVGNPDLKLGSERVHFGFLGDIGRIPTNAEGIAALLTKPAALPVWATNATARFGVGWNGPYLPTGASGVDFTTDAWGNAYVYDSTVNPATITSLGADGAAGGTGLNQDIVVQVHANVRASNIYGVIRNGGAVYAGPAEIILSYPNGSGAVATQSTSILAAVEGAFSFTNKPMGVQSAVIYIPNQATATTTHGPIIFRAGTPEYLIPVERTNISAAGGGACSAITIGFASANSSGSEANTTVTFVVQLSAPCTSNISVDYATSNGTAVQPGDYTTSAGTLTIPAGSTIGSFNVTIINDATVEANESVIISLSAPSNGAALGTSVHTYSILNNDGAVACGTRTLQFSSSASSGSEATSPAVIAVNLTGGTCTSNITFNYVTSDITAVAPGDYTSASGVGTITAGATTTNISIPIINDVAPEGAENFRITLSNVQPLNATLGLSVHTRTIDANDGGAACPRTAGFTLNNSAALESVTTRSATVQMSGTCTVPVTFNYVTSDGTANQPGDYTQTFGTVTIPAGSTTASISIPIINDAISEVSESFDLTLSSPSAADVTLTTSVHTFQIMNDDSAPTYYYVRVTGNNANAGTSPATAWRTITRAATTLTAGQTVFIGGGTYTEGNINPANSGTAANPITYRGDPSGSNTGDAGTITLNTGGNKCFDFANKTYIVIDSLDMNAGGNDCIDAGGTVTGLTVRNSIIRNGDRGIYMRSGTNFRFESNRIHSNNQEGIYMDNNVDDVTIVNNLIYNNDFGIFCERNNNNLIIQNNTIYNSASDQLFVGNNGTATVTNNIITNGNGDGIVENGAGAVVTNNYNNVWNNGTNYNGLAAGANSISINPQYVNAGAANFRVAPTNGTVDSGSVNATAVTLSDGSSLGDRTTRSDNIRDGDTINGDGLRVNMGYHY